MHRHIGQAVPGDHGAHPRIELPGRNIIDDHRAEAFDDPLDDLAAECIDRNRHARREAADGRNAPLHAEPLLLGGHLRRTGTRRIAAHVDDRAAGIDRLLHPPRNRILVRRPASGEERIGRDVENRHDLTPAQIDINSGRLHRGK